MERRQLEYFLAVADAGSFTGAARVLTIAQPSLSQSVRSLEVELGASLFERHGRGVQLTPAGEALVGPARRAVRSFAEAAGAVRGVGDAGFARLAIVSATPWAVEPLVPLVAAYRRIRPRVRITVSDPANRAVAIEQVRSGEVALALVDGTPPGGALASLPLVEHDLVAVLPPGLRAGPHPTWADLVRLGLVTTPRGTALRDLLDERLAELAPDAEPAVVTAHVASLVPLVLAGAGVAVLPAGMATDAIRQGARTAPLDPPVRVPVSLVWRPDHLSDAAADLVDTARGLVQD